MFGITLHASVGLSFKSHTPLLEACSLFPPPHLMAVRLSTTILAGSSRLQEEVRATLAKYRVVAGQRGP